ncbi:MAG TPA: histidine kinase [Beijerinckiaceae bacterium]|jgi:DNA-binding response OmpR family regulator
MNDCAQPRPLILLAEDEAIIALELADSLEREGFAVAGPFTTCTAAEAWLQHQEPAGAILDNALKDGPCETLAGDLRARGIPFVVYSGHDHRGDAPAAFAGVPWLVKPVPFETLLGALRSALA